MKHTLLFDIQEATIVIVLSLIYLLHNIFIFSVGVSFSIFSYNGYARIGVLIDRAVASDDHTAKRLADSVVTEFHKLYSIVQRSEL